MFNNFTNLKTGGLITTCRMRDCNLSNNHSDGYMWDGTEAVSFSIDMRFDETYMESGRGKRPFKVTQAGTIDWKGGGFEAFCRDVTGTDAEDTAYIELGSATRLSMHGQPVVEWASKNQALTGEINFIRLGPDHIGISLDGVRVSMNYNKAAPPTGEGARTGHNYKFIRQSGYGTPIKITNCDFSGTGFDNHQEALRAYSIYGDPLYTPRSVVQSGNQVRTQYDRTWENSFPHRKSFPISTGGSQNTAPVEVAGIATTTVWSDYYEHERLGAGRTIRISIVGRKTGTAGNKKLVLKITDTGSPASYDVTIPNSDEDNFHTEIELGFRAVSAQSLSVRMTEGDNKSRVRNYNLSKQNYDYPFLLELDAVVEAAGDKIFIDRIAVDTH